MGTSLTFSSSSTFDVDINGTSAYDSIAFPGGIGVVLANLNDATLDVHLGTAVRRRPFTIMN